jgi:hypothetical protein
VTDEIVLTLPRQRRFYDVVHLVVGGLAVRLDLTVDNLSDLQVALDGLLPREDPNGDVTVTLRVENGSLLGRIGPFDAASLQRELANDGDGYGTELVLKTVFESYKVEDDPAGAWVAFSMDISAQSGNGGA